MKTENVLVVSCYDQLNKFQRQGLWKLFKGNFANPIIFEEI